MKFYHVLLVLLSINLFACSSAPTVIPDNTPRPVPATVTAYLNQHPDALQNLQANHVNLLQLGDDDRFIIPSLPLFNGLGDRIDPATYPMLDQIIAIIQTIPKESITIQAYTFENASNDLAIRLTDLQAQAVGNYLMSHGVNVRLIYSIGMGNHNQVTQSPDRLLENYRIEITLKELKTRLPG